MRTKKQLRDYYHTKLQENIRTSQESLVTSSRPARFYYQLSALLISLSIMSAFIAFEFNEEQDYYYASFLFLSFVFGVMSISPFEHMMIDRPRKDKRNSYENLVLKKLINFIDTSLHFHPFRSISRSQVIKSSLIKDLPVFQGKNLTIGLINRIKIEFSDLSIRDYQNNESYQGVLLVAEFPRHFSSNLLILPDEAEKSFGTLLGTWLQRNNLNQKNLIKMDDLEFEKEFVVYGNNQIEARYILTHTLMHQLIQINNKIHKNISVSFSGAKMNLWLPSIGYEQSLNLNKDIKNFEYIRPYIDTIYSILDMISLLKLDERIWSKK